MKKHWFNAIFRLTGHIHKVKQKMLRHDIVLSTLLFGLWIIFLEVVLAFLSFPLYVGRDHVKDPTFFNKKGFSYANYKKRKQVTLSAFTTVMVISLAFLFYANVVRGATLTWDGGGADNDWTTCENWTTDTCPSSGDTIVFDSTSTDNSNIDATHTVFIMQVNSGYTGIITQNTGSNLNASIFSMGAAATFTGSNSASDELNLNSFALSGTGTFTSTRGTLKITTTNSFASTATFNHNSGTVHLDNDAAAHRAFQPVGTTFYNLTVDGSGTWGWDMVGGTNSATVEGHLNLTNGVLEESSSEGSRITLDSDSVNADLTIGSSFQGGDGLIEIIGSGSYTWTMESGSDLPDFALNAANVTINTTALGSAGTIASTTVYTGTLDLKDMPMTVGKLTQEGGTIYGGSGANTLTIGDVTTALDQNAGTFHLGSATTTFSGLIDIDAGVLNGGGGPVDVNSSLTVGASGEYQATSNTTFMASSLNVTDGGVLDHNLGRFVLDSTCGCDITHNTTSTFTLYDLTYQGANTRDQEHSNDLWIVLNDLRLIDGEYGTGVLRAEGDIYQGPNFDGGDGHIKVVGLGDQSFTGGVGDSAAFLPNFTINKTSGNFYLGGTSTLDVYRLGPGNWTYLQGNVITGSSTMKAYGDLTETVSLGTSTSSMSFYDLNIDSGTLELAGTLNLDNNLFGAGGFDANGEQVNIGGNWNLAGAFTHDNNEVVFNGDQDQEILVAEAWYDFTVTSTQGVDKTFTLPASAEQTITNDFTFMGDALTNLILVSSVSSTQADIDPQGARTIGYMEVVDNNNVNATEIDVSAENVIDNGNNENWNFGLPTISSMTVEAVLDGTGDVTVAFQANDQETDPVDVKVEYEETSSCGYASPSAATVSTTISSAYGSVTVDNGQTQQIRQIPTTSGINSVTSTWSSATDVASADGTYCVYLVGFDGLNDDDDTVSTTLTLDNVDPAVPGSLTAGSPSAAGEAVLTFGAQSSDTNFDEYIIFYKAGSFGVTTADTEFSSSTDSDLAAVDYNSTTDTTVTGLDSNTQYVFNIWAYDTFNNNSPASTEVVMYSGAAVPTSASASAGGSDSVTVSWNANGNPAGTEYSVDISAGGSGSSGWITDTSYTFSGLSAGTSYTFDVKARNGDNVETSTASASASTEASGGSSGSTGGGGGPVSGGFGGTSPLDDPADPEDEAISGFINVVELVTTDRLVNIELSAPNATDFALSEDVNFTGASFQPYTDNTTFMLSAGEGTKTVYARFRSSAGVTADDSDSVCYLVTSSSCDEDSEPEQPEEQQQEEPEAPPPPPPPSGDPPVRSGGGEEPEQPSEPEAPPPPDTGETVAVTEEEVPPPPLTCGNGIVEEGEFCDDGNDTDTDSCDNMCSTAAYYKFDEGSGSTAIDSSGNNNTGVITGATYTTDVPDLGAEPNQSALVFDSKGDFVTVQAGPQTNLHRFEGITLEATIKPAELPIPVDGVGRRLNYIMWAADDVYSLRLHSDDSGNTFLFGGINCGGRRIGLTDYALTTPFSNSFEGQFTKVAMTFYNGVMKLYINGQEVRQGNDGGVCDGRVGPVGGNIFRIGSDETAVGFQGYEREFKGVVDEVRIKGRSVPTVGPAVAAPNPITLPPGTDPLADGGSPDPFFFPAVDLSTVACDAHLGIQPAGQTDNPVREISLSRNSAGSRILNAYNGGRLIISADASAQSGFSSGGDIELTLEQSELDLVFDSRCSRYILPEPMFVSWLGSRSFTLRVSFPGQEAYEIPITVNGSAYRSVTNVETGLPLRAVSVTAQEIDGSGSLIGRAVNMRTSPQGLYGYFVPPTGQYQLSAARGDYNPTTVGPVDPPNDLLSQNIRMTQLETFPDRDSDGVSDFDDACDANMRVFRSGLPEARGVDTPLGTVVDRTNGCPIVDFNATGVSIPPWYITSRQVNQFSDGTRPTERYEVLNNNGRIRVGLIPGEWFLDWPTDNIFFTVLPNGDVEWSSSLGEVFDREEESGVTTVNLQGFSVAVDVTGVAPRDNMQLIALGGANSSLNDVTSLTLYPRPYYTGYFYMPRFRVGLNGSVTWTPLFDDVFNFDPATRRLAVSGVPVCTQKLQGDPSYRYNFLRQGWTTPATQSAEYRVLPTFPEYVYTDDPQQFNTGEYNTYDGRFFYLYPYLHRNSNNRAEWNTTNLMVRLGPTRLRNHTTGVEATQLGVDLGDVNLRAMIGSCPTVVPTFELPTRATIDSSNTRIPNESGIIRPLIGAMNIVTFPDRQVDLVVDAVDNTFEDVVLLNLVLENTNIPFTYNELSRTYTTTFRSPETLGSISGRIQVSYTDGSQDEAEIFVETVSYGRVIIRGSETPVSGATVRLLPAAGTTGFERRLTTNNNGEYGFLVEDGNYELFTSANGYRDRNPPIFTVNNGVVNQNVELISTPANPSPGDTAGTIVSVVVEAVSDGLVAAPRIISRSTSRLLNNVDFINDRIVVPVTSGVEDSIETVTELAEGTREFAELVVTDPAQAAVEARDTTVAVAQATGRTLVATTRIVREFSDIPEVEEAAENVVAPVAAVAATAVVVTPVASSLLGLLQYLFLQPLMLLGLRKRKGWGVVYNSVDKLPIDLAIVRLVDVNTNRLIQSRVTDKKGRYFFQAQPGLYRLEVQKQGFVFPSHILNKIRVDGRKLDLYHGDTIEVKEGERMVTPNIPVDPPEAKATPKRIAFTQYIRGLQHGAAWAGVVINGASLYITPSVMTASLFGVQLAVAGIFLRLAKPKKPRNWGVIRDKKSDKTIGRAIVRLYTTDYNRLVDTQITNSKGRYAFLVGPNTYYITIEKEGYKMKRSVEINVKDSDQSFIKANVSLEPDPGYRRVSRREAIKQVKAQMRHAHATTSSNEKIPKSDESKEE